MDIRMSERFKRAYRRASPKLQSLTESKVHDFVLRYRSSPATVLRNYDRLARLSEPVIEIDIAGGPRLLAHFAGGCLLLLDMGGHEIVGRYDWSMFQHDIQVNDKAPSQFWPDVKQSFFLRFAERADPTIHYGQEVNPDEWIYFLEGQQQEVFEQISDAILNRQPYPHFVMGGPGTGKTCILLNLLKVFVDLDLSVGISISDELTSYLESVTGLNIGQYRVDKSSTSSLDLHLVDDPGSISSLKLSNVHKGMITVVAFDPLQLYEDITDASLDKIALKLKARRYVLGICYRQKENVGKTSKHIIDNIANSTPFLRRDKIESFRNERKGITLLSNQLQFVNPFGYSNYYVCASLGDLKLEVKRITSHDWLMWKNWPSLLIVTESKLPDEIYNILAPLIQKKYARIVLLDQVETVKGLEFQHVFLIISKLLFEELEGGFRGAGQRIYHTRRLLRIPFSRSKDSIVVFAMGDYSGV